MTDDKKKSMENLERSLLVVIVGLCTALQEGCIEIVDAHHVLLKPATMQLLEELGHAPELIDLIHEGTELEDVESLLPENLPRAFEELKAAALRRLSRLSLGKYEEFSWLIQCLEEQANRSGTPD